MHSYLMYLTLIIIFSVHCKLPPQWIFLYKRISIGRLTFVFSLFPYHDKIMETSTRVLMQVSTILWIYDILAWILLYWASHSSIQVVASYLQGISVNLKCTIGRVGPTGGASSFFLLPCSCLAHRT